MTITEFLLARISEDEAAARAADVKQGDPSWVSHGPIALAYPRAYRIRSERDRRPIALVEDVSGDDTDPDHETSILDGDAAATHIARHDPSRVLAECEAKRRIIELHAGAHDEAAGHSIDGYDDEAPCPTLAALAAVYADHSDYDPAWRMA